MLPRVVCVVSLGLLATLCSKVFPESERSGRFPCPLYNSSFVCGSHEDGCYKYFNVIRCEICDCVGPDYNETSNGDPELAALRGRLYHLVTEAKNNPPQTPEQQNEFQYELAVVIDRLKLFRVRFPY